MENLSAYACVQPGSQHASTTRNRISADANTKHRRRPEPTPIASLLFHSSRGCGKLGRIPMVLTFVLCTEKGRKKILFAPYAGTLYSGFTKKSIWCCRTLTKGEALRPPPEKSYYLIKSGFRFQYIYGTIRVKIQLFKRILFQALATITIFDTAAIRTIGYARSPRY